MQEVLERCQRETAEKRDKGLCVEPECTALALKDNSALFFGEDHCEQHARHYELEFLIEDQEDDANGR